VEPLIALSINHNQPTATVLGSRVTTRTANGQQEVLTFDPAERLTSKAVTEAPPEQSPIYKFLGAWVICRRGVSAST